MKRKSRLVPFREDGLINVIVESAKGSRNKYAYDEEARLLVLKKILPCGMVFPFDFGCVPGTRADDGDPLDVLVLMEDPVVPPCLVEAVPIGVIKAEQTENGKTERNDRLIAVTRADNREGETKSIKKLDPKTLKEIEKFFVSYNELQGKTFEVIEYKGRKAALALIKKSEQGFKRNK